MATFAVILPAAGKSTRFASEMDFSSKPQKKPFVDLSGRAIWLRSAELFVNRDDVVQTILVIAADDMEWFKEKYRANLAFMDIEIVAGGDERSDSVRNGLEHVRADVDYVAVHDAARPLLVSEWIDAVFQEAEKSGAAIRHCHWPARSSVLIRKTALLRQFLAMVCGPLKRHRCSHGNYFLTLLINRGTSRRPTKHNWSRTLDTRSAL